MKWNFFDNFKNIFGVDKWIFRLVCNVAVILAVFLFGRRLCRELCRILWRELGRRLGRRLGQTRGFDFGRGFCKKIGEFDCILSSCSNKHNWRNNCCFQFDLNIDFLGTPFISRIIDGVSIDATERRTLRVATWFQAPGRERRPGREKEAWQGKRGQAGKRGLAWMKIYRGFD